MDEAMARMGRCQMLIARPECLMVAARHARWAFKGSGNCRLVLGENNTPRTRRDGTAHLDRLRNMCHNSSSRQSGGHSSHCPCIPLRERWYRLSAPLKASPPPSLADASEQGAYLVRRYRCHSGSQPMGGLVAGARLLSMLTAGSGVMDRWQKDCERAKARER